MEKELKELWDIIDDVNTALVKLKKYYLDKVEDDLDCLNVSLAYKEYRLNNGTLSWNEFQKVYKLITKRASK